MIAQAASRDRKAGFTLQPPLNLRLDGIIDSEVLDQKGSWAEEIHQRASTSTEHDPADPGLQQCCAAHWTRFGGAIERAAAEVALAQPTARLTENGEAVVGERIAMGDLRTARLGHGLAGSSHDGAEPRIASVGCRGRLIQSQSHQDFVISHDEILPCRTLRVRHLCLSDPKVAGSTSDWHPSPARADTPHGDYSNRHTARFITITDTTMEVEGDVTRTQVACRKRTRNRASTG
jgi:hypothetical protein